MNDLVKNIALVALSLYAFNSFFLNDKDQTIHSVIELGKQDIVQEKEISAFLTGRYKTLNNDFELRLWEMDGSTVFVEYFDNETIKTDSFPREMISDFEIMNFNDYAAKERGD